MTKAKYLWLDLETTGLDPDDASILECAAIVTDGDLVPIGSGLEMVLRYTREDLQMDRPYISNYVLEMHAKSGLWEACHASTINHVNLTVGLNQIIDAHEWAEGKPILAGSTIHFDRKFLVEWCFATHEKLHYRMHDVSSLRMAAIDLFGRDYPKSTELHRARADIEESLRLARELYEDFARGARG